jgi:hypothetical protein
LSLLRYCEMLCPPLRGGVCGRVLSY